MISDSVTTTREDVVSMIHCADDYGHNNQVAMLFFWELLGCELTDNEIKEYADSLLSDPAYSQEDYDSAVEELTGWRARLTSQTCKGDAT